MCDCKFFNQTIISHWEFSRYSIMQIISQNCPLKNFWYTYQSIWHPFKTKSSKRRLKLSNFELVVSTDGICQYLQLIPNFMNTFQLENLIRFCQWLGGDDDGAELLYSDWMGIDKFLMYYFWFLGKNHRINPFRRS